MDIIPTLDTIAVLVLAAITIWYAASTARILKAMLRQAEIQVLTAQVIANSALLTRMYDEGKARRELGRVIEKLHRLEQESSGR